MRLELNRALARPYKSAAQQARRMTEGWFAQNMYCPACPSERLQATRDNTRVVDFFCPSCGAEFQLKAKSGAMGKKLRDAAYEPMMERIVSNRCPHFAFLSYQRDECRVRHLLLVPGHFVTPNVIERCKPLSSSARRAGWVGCNILLHKIPPHGRLHVIEQQRVLPRAAVRNGWARFAWLARRPLELRGWTAEVLRCIAELGRQHFTLQDVYRCERQLALLYPNNRHIRAKIRQQLQLLRDKGIIRFTGRGRYEILRG